LVKPQAEGIYIAKFILTEIYSQFQSESSVNIILYLIIEEGDEQIALFVPLQHNGEACGQARNILTLIATSQYTILTQTLQDHGHVSFKRVLGRGENEPETVMMISF